jgi:hypothetical protein
MTIVNQKIWVKIICWHSTEHSRVDGHALATKRAHTVRILLHTRARYIRVDIADRECIGHQLLHARRRVNPRLELVDCTSGGRPILMGRMAVDNKEAQKIREDW